MIEALKALAEQERHDSYHKYPRFHSMHEGTHVLREEIEEAVASCKSIEELYNKLWEETKRVKHLNANTLMLALLEGIYEFAVSGAEELLQVAAMCRKTTESLGEIPNSCPECGSIEGNCEHDTAK